MSYQAKTDWKKDDPITEQDVNRWEQGIKDANDGVGVLNLQMASVEGRVKSLESSLANDMRDNQFAFDFSAVAGMKISKGWWDKANARLVIK